MRRYCEFANGATFQTIPHGKGRIFVAAEPVELADDLGASEELYSWALGQAGVKPLFDGAIPPGVLIRPVVFADSVFYLIVSESADDSPLDLRDRTTGGTIHFTLDSGRARLLLFSRHGGQLISSFGELHARDWATISPMRFARRAPLRKEHQMICASGLDALG